MLRNPLVLFAVLSLTFLSPVISQDEKSSHNVPANRRVRIQPDSAVLTPTELDRGWMIFRDTSLGIRFKYNSPLDEPSRPHHPPFAPSDISIWRSFSSSRFGLSFRYPPELQLRVLDRSEWYPSADDSSQAIALDYQCRASSEKGVKPPVVRLVTLYLSGSSFENIAFSLGFEIGYMDQSKWLISGTQGPYEASVLDGKMWKGLRGHVFTDRYDGAGNSHGIVGRTSSFLVHQVDAHCDLVASFSLYDDTGGDQQVDVDEATFYKMVSTIQLGGR